MVDRLSRYFAAVLVASMLGSAAFGADTKAASDDYAKGADLVAKRSYKEAIPFLDKAIQADSKNAEALIDRALCNFHLGEYKKVVEDCKAVADNGSADQVAKRQAFMMSAGAHNALGEYSDAAQSCDKAIELAPRASLCYSDRAFAYQQLKRYDEALRDCNEAIKLDSKHASNYELRAALYETLARQDRAKVKELITARKPGEKPYAAKAGEKTAEDEKSPKK